MQAVRVFGVCKQNVCGVLCVCVCVPYVWCVVCVVCV